MEGKANYIVRYGEVALKGRNKPYFERMLIERIKKVTKDLNDIQVVREEGLIMVYAPEELPAEEITRRVTRVFGVDTVSPAVEVIPNINVINEAAISYVQKLIDEKGIKTFKVEGKRSDKSFPIESPQIGKLVGAEILKACKVLKVDVHNPDCMLYVHVRKGKCLIYDQKISGCGGLPPGTNGRGMVLLSGGIDSPVAAWMMAKRGMIIEGIHYHSYPYTSQRAWEKVQDLAKILTTYCGRMKVHSVNLLPIQEQIVEKCPEELTTILVRRFMMRIAEEMAKKTNCTMLITGENLGQVASQTAESLVVTDSTVQMPVMRPLIALDKWEIIERAQEIGTYETSIQPFEDCCTVFLPKHPATKPRLERVLEAEARFDWTGLVQEAIDSRETVLLTPED